MAPWTADMMYMTEGHGDGLVQGCGISSTLSLEMLQSSIKRSIYTVKMGLHIDNGDMIETWMVLTTLLSLAAREIAVTTT